MFGLDVNIRLFSEEHPKLSNSEGMILSVLLAIIRLARRNLLETNTTAYWAGPSRTVLLLTGEK